MAYKIINLPIQDGEAAEDELNKFLRSHTVLSIDRQWVDQGSHSFWSFCIDYLDPAVSRGESPQRRSQRPKVDYRELLNEADFAVFANLRELRKEVAGAEGVPVYTVFNNEQLAKMVQDRAKTGADLESIVGVGDARVEKYGERFLVRLAEALAASDEKSGESV